MKQRPIRQERPEDVRARDLVLRELSKLDSSRFSELAEVNVHVDRTKTFIDVMPAKDGKMISFVVDGRTVWQDVTVQLTLEWFKQSGLEFAQAFDVCVQLVKVASSHPVGENPTLAVGSFLIWTGEEDQEAWAAILSSWLPE